MYFVWLTQMVLEYVIRFIEIFVSIPVRENDYAAALEFG